MLIPLSQVVSQSVSSTTRVDSTTRVVSQSESSTIRKKIKPYRVVRSGRPFSALGSSRLAIAYLKTCGLPPPHLISSYIYDSHLTSFLLKNAFKRRKTLVLALVSLVLHNSMHLHRSQCFHCVKTDTVHKTRYLREITRFSASNVVFAEKRV